MKKFIIFYVSVSLVFSFNVSANAKTKYIKIKGNISHNLTYSPKKAIKVLKKLKVKKPNGENTYKNVKIPSWLSAGKYGWDKIKYKYCNGRNATLKRDAYKHKIKVDSHCTVLSGVWKDTYTGIIYKIIKRSDVEKIHVDHVVPKKLAWISGAYKWNNMQLRKFINEPLELVVSYWSVNSKKGNKDASKWQPEINKCGYAVRYIEIKHKFHLILINREEKLALKKMLNTCIVR